MKAPTGFPLRLFREGTAGSLARLARRPWGPKNLAVAARKAQRRVTCFSLVVAFSCRDCLLFLLFLFVCEFFLFAFLSWVLLFCTEPVGLLDHALQFGVEQNLRDSAR